MNYSDGLSIRPGDVGDATNQLTELADRVKHTLETEALNLTVEASGRDEVSQRVATTLNEVRASFTKASDQGHQQLRDVAATLRTHAGNVEAADQGLSV